MAGGVVEKCSDILTFEYMSLIEFNFINILDIDECISNLCDKNALCIDGINLYTCKCNKGFTGDGTSCTGNLDKN